MTENIANTDYTYPEKFRKRNIWYGKVTAAYLMAMHGKSRNSAHNLLKRIKERLGKEHIFIADVALHFGYSSIKEYVEETNRNLTY